MRQTRTHKEVDELVALARRYCEARACYERARREGRLSPSDDDLASQQLAGVDERLGLLNSSSEIDRRRARVSRNIVELAQFRRRAVR